MTANIWVIRKENRYDMAGALCGSLIIHAVLFFLMASTSIYYPATGEVAQFDIFWFSPSTSPMEAPALAAMPEAATAASVIPEQTDVKPNTVEPPQFPVVDKKSEPSAQPPHEQTDENSPVELIAARAAQAKPPSPPVKPPPKPKKTAILIPKAEPEREKNAKTVEPPDKAEEAKPEDRPEPPPPPPQPPLPPEKDGAATAEEQSHAALSAKHERLAQEKAERQQAAAEAAREKAEQKRRAAEAAREKVDQERQAAEAARLKTEQERLSRLKAEREQREAARLQQEKLARERKQVEEKAERERQAAEALRRSTEQERLGAERVRLATLARAQAEQRAAEAVPKETPKPRPVEPPPIARGIVIPSIHGDLKLIIAESNDIKLTVLFREYPKSRWNRGLTRSEARREQKITPIVVKTKEKTREAVIEKTREGIYTFMAEPDGTPSATATFTLKSYEQSQRAKTKPLGAKTIAGKAIVARILMPDAILWEDETSFTGSMEDSGGVTKFNAETGLVWKEYRD